MSNFTPPAGICLLCENDGIKVYGTLASNGLEITCARGHSFANMDDFQEGVTKQERKKMKKELDGEAKKLFGTGKIDQDVVPAIIQKNENDISIDEVNQARLVSLVGPFTDASSLVGLVYSMHAEMSEMAETMKNAKKARVGEEDGKILPSGDLQFSGIIPERHVQPLIDLSHSWNRNVTDYCNERMIELFDGMLFY